MDDNRYVKNAIFWGRLDHPLKRLSILREKSGLTERYQRAFHCLIQQVVRVIREEGRPISAFRVISTTH